MARGDFAFYAIRCTRSMLLRRSGRRRHVVADAQAGSLLGSATGSDKRVGSAQNMPNFDNG